MPLIISINTSDSCGATINQKLFHNFWINPLLLSFNFQTIRISFPKPIFAKTKTSLNCFQKRLFLCSIHDASKYLLSITYSPKATTWHFANLTKRLKYVYGTTFGFLVYAGDRDTLGTNFADLKFMSSYVTLTK